jgi:hypothetical protein
MSDKLPGEDLVFLLNKGVVREKIDKILNPFYHRIHRFFEGRVNVNVLAGKEGNESIYLSSLLEGRFLMMKMKLIPTVAVATSLGIVLVPLIPSLIAEEIEVVHGVDAASEKEMTEEEFIFLFVSSVIASEKMLDFANSARLATRSPWMDLFKSFMEGGRDRVDMTLTTFQKTPHYDLGLKESDIIIDVADISSIIG